VEVVVRLTRAPDFQKQLRAALPKPYLISHAPIAPWFSGTQAGGGYKAIHKAVGDGIDFYNVQFYNQLTEYETCQVRSAREATQAKWATCRPDAQTLVHKGVQFPGTSILEINSMGGVPLDKIVLGKPISPDKTYRGG
jgi:chitinase